MVKKIPYGRQLVDAEDIKAVVRVLNSDYLTQGPTGAKFENKVAQFCGVKYAVAFASGTAALHAACFAAEISQGDEVITSPLTFVASANCVLYCGGTPIFADIKKDFPLIDPGSIKQKISLKTKAVIPIDYSGIPADYDEINRIAQRLGLVVIADAAHSLGATYKKRKVGTLADMTVFSFHPVKLITTGEGGMVVTNRQRFYERLLLFRNHGITKLPKFLKKKDVGPWYYEMLELGFNYRMTEIQAALGLSQIRKIGLFLQKRSQLAEKYTALFKHENYLHLPSVSEDRTSAWHLYPIQLVERILGHKKKIVEDLHRQGVMVQIHYIPVHLHPYYQKRFGFVKGAYPQAERFYEGELSLPLYPGLTVPDIDRVVSILQRTVKQFTY